MLASALVEWSEVRWSGVGWSGVECVEGIGERLEVPEARGGGGGGDESSEVN